MERATTLWHTGRVWNRVVRAVVGLVALSMLPVLVLRWVPPLATSFMVGRWMEGALGRRPAVAIEYDWTPWDRIAPVMKLAVVAAEDQRFPTHHGFDLTAIRRAMEERRAAPRGASTITQQLARNLFLWSGRSWPRKVLEAYATVLLEVAWSKRRILEVYLNVAEFGDGVYGVEAASRHFFRKSAAALTRHEAALLAAVLPNPKALHVARPSAFVLVRAGRIEAQMTRLGAASLAAL
jgi:monofunctional biosynthetic peptidoglycan transglycosylase